MFKNKLQEHFQKQNKPIPEYLTLQVSGLSHNPKFQSHVTLYDGQQIQGDICGTKKQAEQSSAENALKLLNKLPELNNTVSTPIKSTPRTDSSTKTCILIDLENMHTFPNKIIHLVDEMDVYVFVGEHHHLAEKEFPAGVVKILSPSSRKDGADTCMQVQVGMWLATDKYNYYYIVTKDHFGPCLVDMITSPAFGSRQAKHVTKVSDIC